MRVITLLFTLMLGLNPAYAGWLGDAVKDAAESIGSGAVIESSDNPSESETVKEPAQEGNESMPPSPASNKGMETAQKTAQGAGTAEGKGDIVSSEAIYGKYDFIPGSKVLFFDDFRDTDIGEFPRKWTLKGPGGGGNTVEVVDYRGTRFLRSVPPSSKDEGLPASSLYVRVPVQNDMPEKFTVEFDAVLGNAEGYPNEYYLLMYDESGWPGHNPGSIYISGEKGSSQNTSTSVNKNDGRVHHIAVSVNGTFVKAYIDEQRVVNDPDAITRPLKHIGISFHANHGYSETVMFTNFRLAEGGKDMKAALDTDGKIVTHGILFDTGSDKIKPESLPTLKKIFSVMEESPSLKFSIEGHTDNQGTKELNQSLSERRAKAVQSWLTGKGISAARLQSKGWGDAKPIDSNDTSEGRANNRRVEFLKIQ